MKIVPFLVIFSVMSSFSQDSSAVKIMAVFQAKQEAVIAARVDSVVMKVHTRPGEPFKSGDTLVSLDTSRLDIEARRGAERLAFAKAAYEDRKRLHSEKLTSDFELKKSEFEYKSQETNLAEAQLNLSFCTIKAPFDGKIEELLTHEHETTRPGQALMKIIDDTSLLAVAFPPIGLKDEYKSGARVKIQMDGGLVAEGVVYEVAPKAEHRSQTIQIKVLVENGDGIFTAGMTGVLLHGK